MDALAQEAESAVPQATEVWGVVSQWPILLLFLAGFAFAYWLFVVRKKEHAPEGNGHADLRALITNGFASTTAALENLHEDFRKHDERDNERFGRLEEHLLWDGQTDPRQRTGR